MKNIFLFFLIGIKLPVLADQSNPVQVDSVKIILNSSKSNKEAIDKLILFSKRNLYLDPPSAKKAAEKALEISEKTKNLKGMAMSHDKLGSVLLVEGAYRAAADHIGSALDYYTELNDKTGMANCYDNIAIAYINLTEHSKGIESLFKSVKIWKELKKDTDLASTYSNIGNAYAMMGEFDKALHYFESALEIKNKNGDAEDIAYTLGNMGNVYFSLGELEKALSYYEKSVVTFHEAGNLYGEANFSGNVGMVYATMKNFDKAEEYIRKSIEQRTTMGDEPGLAYAYNSLSTLYFDKGNYSKAIEFAGKSLAHARKSEAQDIRSITLKLMSDIYEHQSDFKNALKYYKEYAQLIDTIKNDEKKNEVTKRELNFEYEKKLAADSVKTAEEKKVTDATIAANEAQLEQEQTQRYALYGGLGFLFLFSGVMFNRFRVTQRQKKLIEIQKSEVETQRNFAQHQKEMVEEKNKEILDSITYAKRLQEAILPPLRLVREYLPDSFILYKPKDIVAGDFYFMEPVGKKIIFAAADCTGHGVPGAMVSVVCSNALNRTVKEFGITEAGKILDKVRELVLETFSRSESDVKDGMDISLCVLDTVTNELHWSGANNPLWIIRNNKICDFKPNKQPIGKSADAAPFKDENIKLEKGDLIYIFTDGYEDQFGGEKGKKFKSANMKKLLLSIQHESMDSQRQKINFSFEEWKGELEQVDDVCIIGVRL